LVQSKATGKSLVRLPPGRLARVPSLPVPCENRVQSAQSGSFCNPMPSPGLTFAAFARTILEAIWLCVSHRPSVFWGLCPAGKRITARVHTRPYCASDVTRHSLRLHGRLLACGDGWERFMFEVLSKTCSSMTVPQENPLLATRFCLPAARRCTPIILRQFPYRTLVPANAAWPQARRNFLVSG
jgi:hypothetical protein